MDPGCDILTGYFRPTSDLETNKTPHDGGAELNNVCSILRTYFAPGYTNQTNKARAKEPDRRGMGTIAGELIQRNNKYKRLRLILKSNESEPLDRQTVPVLNSNQGSGNKHVTHNHTYCAGPYPVVVFPLCHSHNDD